MTKRLLVVPYRNVRPLSNAIKIAQAICSDMGWTMDSVRMVKRCGYIVVEER